MKTVNMPIYLIIMVLFFIGCNKSQKNIETNNNDFVLVDSVILEETDILKPYDIFVQDSLCYFSVSHSLNHVSILNLNNLSSTHLLEKGNAPNQMIHYRRLKDKKFDIFKCVDMDRKIFYTIEGGIHIKEDFRMSDKIPHIFNVSQLNDSIIITTGSFTQGRILFYNKKRDTYSYQLNYPETEKTKELSQLHKSILYNGSIIESNIDGDRFVLIDNGFLDFYNYKKDSAELINSYKYHEKIFNLRNNGHIITYDKKSVVGFFNVTSDAKYVYLCYTDETYENTLQKERVIFGNTILIYDWNGNFIRKCFLDRDVCSIYRKDKYLWGLSSYGDILYKFELNNL